MQPTTQQRVAAIYARILALDHVEADDGLYSLGADSQQAVRIALDVERTFRVSLPIEVMEASGVVRDVAAWVDDQLASGGVVVAPAPAWLGPSRP